MSDNDKKEKFKALPPKKKLEYIWDYYKIPILVVLFVLIAGGSFIHQKMTEKTPIIYVATINIEPTEKLTAYLTDDFTAQYGDPKKECVYLYNNLYLSESPEASMEYVAASRMKITASAEAQQLDVVMGPKEVLDSFLEEGYVETYEKCSYFAKNGYEDTVYYGVLVNTPRMEMVENFKKYINK